MADYRLDDRERDASVGGEGDEGVAKGMKGRFRGADSPPFYLHACLDMRCLEYQFQPVAYSPSAVLVVVGKRGVNEWRW